MNDNFLVSFFMCYDTQVSITGPSWPSCSILPQIFCHNFTEMLLDSPIPKMDYVQMFEFDWLPWQPKVAKSFFFFLN